MDFKKMLEGLDPNKATEIATALEAMVEEEMAGLKSKNYELLSKLRKARESGGTDSELAGKIEDLQISLDESRKAMEKLKADSEKKIAEYENALKSERQKLVDARINTGLTENLAKLGVNPVMTKYIVSAVKPSVKYEEKDGTYNLKIGDKALDDWIAKDWANSEEGKAFIVVKSSGSGASGNGGNSGEKTIKRAEFEQLPPHERLAKVKDGYAVTD